MGTSRFRPLATAFSIAAHAASGEDMVTVEIMVGEGKSLRLAGVLTLDRVETMDLHTIFTIGVQALGVQPTTTVHHSGTEEITGSETAVEPSDRSG